MSYPNLERFGYHIKQARLQHGWEPSVLADKVHMSVTDLIDIERGRKDVSIVYAQLLAYALDVSITELL